LEAVIYDWDQLGDNEELGRGLINFTNDALESFEAKEVVVPLSEGDSTLKVRLLWQPQLIKREREGTSLLNSTTRAFTSVPGHALGAGVSLAGDAVGLGGKVLGTGGRALGTGGKAVFGGVGKFGSGIRGLGSKMGGGGNPSQQRPSVISEAPSSPVDNCDEMTDKKTIVTNAGPSSTPSTSTTSQPLSPSTLDNRRSIDTVHSTSNMSTIRHNEAVKVHVIGARGLKDSLDCYVRVKNNNKRSLYKTNHIKKNGAPEW
jgi:Ca2+-dependent lipid-binding protein